MKCVPSRVEWLLSRNVDVTFKYLSVSSKRKFSYNSTDLFFDDTQNYQFGSGYFSVGTGQTLYLPFLESQLCSSQALSSCCQP